MEKKLYRYERLRSSRLDAIVRLSTFSVVPETPKGFWIRDTMFYKKRWVSDSGKKRYAYPSKEEAYSNFLRRTERCVLILSERLRVAKMYLNPTGNELP